MTHLDIAKTYIKAAQTGDQATLASVISPDVVWHQPGNNQFSGTHRGMAMVGPMLGRSRAQITTWSTVTGWPSRSSSRALPTASSLGSPAWTSSASKAARSWRFACSPATRKKKTRSGGDEAWAATQPLRRARFITAMPPTASAPPNRMDASTCSPSQSAANSTPNTGTKLI